MIVRLRSSVSSVWLKQRSVFIKSKLKQNKFLDATERISHNSEWISHVSERISNLSGRISHILEWTSDVWKWNLHIAVCISDVPKWIRRSRVNFCTFRYEFWTFQRALRDRKSRWEILSEHLEYGGLRGPTQNRKTKKTLWNVFLSFCDLKLATWRYKEAAISTGKRKSGIKTFCSHRRGRGTSDIRQQFSGDSRRNIPHSTFSTFDHEMNSWLRRAARVYQLVKE